MERIKNVLETEKWINTSANTSIGVIMSISTEELQKIFSSIEPTSIPTELVNSVTVDTIWGEQWNLSGEEFYLALLNDKNKMQPEILQISMTIDIEKAKSNISRITDQIFFNAK